MSKPIKRGRPFGTKRVPDDEKVIKQAVSMRPWHIAKAKKVGAGNISKGVRKALEDVK